MLNVLPALLAAAALAGEPCADAWRADEHEAKWDVGRESWSALCRSGATPEELSRRVRTVFIERCLAAAVPAMQDGHLGAPDAKRLCAEGRPGLARIPAAPELARPGLVAQRARADALGREVAGRIEAGTLPGLYGERSAVAPPPVAAGAGGAVPRLAAPAPPQARPTPAVALSPEGRAADIRVLQERVLAEGASPRAAEKARGLLSAMLEHADPAVVRSLVERDVYVVVIPKDRKLTDLPQFAHLRGQKGIDGRSWDDMRGVANSRLPGGGVAVGVAEENLLPGPQDGYPKNYLFVHEYAHVVHRQGLATRPAAGPDRRGVLALLGDGWRAFRAALAQGGADRRAVLMGRLARSASPAPVSYEETARAFLAGQQRPGGSGMGEYADSHEKEYFAEATTAYFDVSYGDDAPNDLAALRRTRPELAELMFRVYGPARSLRER